MYGTFQKLLDKNGVTAYKVAKETGLTTATLTNWKKGRYTPKQDKLQKIAEYFDVTVDYLLSGDEPEVSEDAPVDMELQIQNLITALTGDNSVYYCGESMSDESRLALLNSLKQDMEFLNALHSKKDE